MTKLRIRWFDIFIIMMFVVSGSVMVLLNLFSTYSPLRIVTGTACFMMLTAMVYVTERVMYIARSYSGLLE